MLVYTDLSETNGFHFNGLYPGFELYGFQVMAGYGMGMAITRKENTNSNIAFNSNNSNNNSNIGGIFSTVTGNFNSI